MHSNNAILITIFLIFLGLAYIIPLVNSQFSQPTSQWDINNYVNTQVVQNVSTADVLTQGTVFKRFLVNLLFIPFWTFGAPVWLNLTIFAVMRLIFLIIIYDKFRGI